MRLKFPRICLCCAQMFNISFSNFAIAETKNLSKAMSSKLDRIVLARLAGTAIFGQAVREKMLGAGALGLFFFEGLFSDNFGS